MAAAHADGQSAGAGEGRSAAVRHHHRQQVLAAILAGEGAPACDDAGRIVCRAKEFERRESEKKKKRESPKPPPRRALWQWGGFEAK